MSDLIAGQIMAHAYVDEMSKIARVPRRPPQAVELAAPDLTNVLAGNAATYVATRGLSKIDSERVAKRARMGLTPGKMVRDVGLSMLLPEAYLGHRIARHHQANAFLKKLKEENERKAKRRARPLMTRVIAAIKNREPSTPK